MIKTGDMVKISPEALDERGSPFSDDREWRVDTVYDDGRYFLAPRLGSSRQDYGPFQESELIPVGAPAYPFEDQIFEMAKEYLGEVVYNANRYRTPPFKFAEMIAHAMFIGENHFLFGDKDGIKRLDKCIIATLLAHLDSGNYFPSRGPRINNFNDMMKFPWLDYNRNS